MALAHDFKREGVRFTPRGSAQELAAKKTKLLIVNGDVHGDDKELSATMSAGTTFGSRRQLAAIKEDENKLMERARECDVSAWNQAPPPPKKKRCS